MATRKRNSGSSSQRKSSFDIIADAINSVGKGSSANIGSRNFQDPDYNSDPQDESLHGGVDALFNEKDAFSHLLGQFAKGGNADSSFEQLLLQLALGNLGKDGAMYGDLQQQLVKMLFDNMVKQEQRSYDEGALQEQRQYDTPANQLARLMGAGISRDAAIQLLGQGGESPLVGSGSQSTAGAEGMMSPSERIMQGLNTAVGLAGAFSSLVSLGFTIPQAIAQTNMLRASAYMSQRQRQAFDAAAEAYGVLQSSGVEINDKTFGNIANVSKIISGLSETGNVLAQGFVSRNGLQTLNDTAPYSMPFLNQMYKNHRDSSDYNRAFELRMGNEEAQKELTEVTTSKMLVDMTAVQETVENLRADTNYKNALAALTGSQKTQVDFANQLEQSWRTPEGLNAYRDQVINNLLFESRKLSYMNNQELWKKQVDTMLKNEEFAQLSLDLCTLYSRGELDYLETSNESTKALLSFCRAAENNGYFEYIRTKVQANTSGNWKFGPVGGSQSGLMFNDVNTNLFNSGGVIH